MTYEEKEMVYTIGRPEWHALNELGMTGKPDGEGWVVVKVNHCAKDAGSMQTVFTLARINESLTVPRDITITLSTR
jgi:hypothetical protein